MLATAHSLTKKAFSLAGFILTLGAFTLFLSAVPILLLSLLWLN